MVVGDVVVDASVVFVLVQLDGDAADQQSSDRHYYLVFVQLSTFVVLLLWST